jgi:alkylhydroperoxidase family enzyme
MGEAEYRDRQSLEMWTWPELEKVLGPFGLLVRGQGEVSAKLKSEAFLVASISAGCLHCQAHGAYGLHLAGMPVTRIRALWDFEGSGQFDPAEIAAYRLARDASVTPNAVTPEHFEELRSHYGDRQIVELVALVALTAFLNRYNDTVAVVTDRESADWATENLSQVGWRIGKHRGTEEEQRNALPPHLRTFSAQSAT